MFNRMVSGRGEEARAGLREWVENSSEQSGFGAVALVNLEGLLRATRTRARLAAAPAAGPTGRSVSRGFDLVAEQWAAVLRLVKLEPLNEP